MAKLLYIESSPRKQRSHSIAVAQSFLESYKTANPNDEVDEWDLWSSELPEFDGDTIDAKYAILHGQNHSESQKHAWQAVVDAANRFTSADKYLISLPMWNFGIPYKLKHLIDVITQPGLTFSFSPETGYDGLVKDKPIAVAYARGGTYSDDSTKGMDYQKPYIEFWLGFIGFTDIRPIVCEGTLSPGAEEARQHAVEAASKIATQF